MYQFIIATQQLNQVSGLTELTDKDGNRTAYCLFLAFPLNYIGIWLVF